jgi:hypothetical protein
MGNEDIRGRPGALYKTIFKEPVYSNVKIENEQHLTEVAHPGILTQYKSIANGAVPLYIVTGF